MNENCKNSFKIILASQYFLYFGAMGIFLPYFNLYCHHLGFSGFQIGTLSALRTLTTVIFSLFWGILADKFHSRKIIYVLCNFASVAIWICYFGAEKFWAMFVITIFYGIFYSPIISFMEAFAMDILGEKKRSYGTIRVWGSIAFIIMVATLGGIIDIYSIKIILPIIFTASLMQALISLKTPNVIIKKESHFVKAKVPIKRRLIIFLFCAFLMLMSHGTYYGFFSIHLSALGYKNTFIGFAWALASIAEIFVMIKSNWIFERFTLENVLIFSFIVAALRWFILSCVVSPVLILMSQILHAVTYGTFHIASILYIDSLMLNKDKTLGQAVNNAITYGLGMMIGFFINGYLYESIGPFNLFIISGFIALSAGIIQYTVIKRNNE